MKKLQTEIESMQIDLLLKDENAPLILLITGVDHNEELIRRAQKMQISPFNLLSISRFDWDACLSPWPHDPIIMQDDHFLGQADVFLKTIETKILPWAQHYCSSGVKILAGYSMGGLFALYASYYSSSFTSICCVSGSLWYPDFLEFCLSHHFQKKPLSIYLSLGKKEIQVKNPYLQKTGAIMERLDQFYRAAGIDTIFEWNLGNHFSDPIGRLCTGIQWTMEQIKKEV